MAFSFLRRHRHHCAVRVRACSAALAVEVEVWAEERRPGAELLAGGWPDRAGWTAADQNCPRCAQRNAVSGALQVGELDALEDAVAVAAPDELADGFRPWGAAVA